MRIKSYCSVSKNQQMNDLEDCKIMCAKYAANINVQLLISLLKEHGIKRIVASPGFTHVEFLGSVQHDNWFEIYSCIDERGAAYMACGIAAETNEPVVITCTESTASRNYIPGLTEAFYRKLPILAITGLHSYNLIGQLEPQVIDRSVSPNDVFVDKVELVDIKSDDDFWDSELKINRALLSLTRNGCGPVHINLPRSSSNYAFNVEKPVTGRVIKRYTYNDALPDLPSGRIAIVCWSHTKWSPEQEKTIEDFCENHNAVVMCDHTSGYHGKFRFSPSLVALQKLATNVFNPNLIINIGEGSGDYNVMRKFSSKANVWRVNPDGEIRDPLKSIVKVFDMREEDFFALYLNKNTNQDHDYYQECISIDNRIRSEIPELPFSNMYIAKEIAPRLPENSVIHLGMSNTIRAWSNFNFPNSVDSYINVGCRGIDGTLSSLIGASIVCKDRIHFGVLGDLSFFYDINSLGNRDIKNNLRIIVINNNGGALFKKKNGVESKWFTFEDVGKYIAASHHFGGRDTDLIMHYANDLGFEYMRASNKEEFSKQVETFISAEARDKSIVFEIRTSEDDESDSFEMMGNLVSDGKNKLKQTVKNIIGDKGVNYAKKLLGHDKKSADFSVSKK